MAFYRITKQLNSVDKAWGVVIEFSDKKKKTWNNQSSTHDALKNLAWTKFQNFCTDNKIDISKEKKRFSLIEYLGETEKEAEKKLKIK